MYDANNDWRYAKLWNYDSRGNVVREINALGEEVINSYDENDNIITQYRPLVNHKIENSYDFMNRLIKQNEIHPDGEEYATNYAYGYLSNCISKTNKAKILKWLENNKFACNPDCVKAELIELLEKHVPEPTYVIDEVAQQSDHEVLRTPPYHPELQPIEVCWAVVKNEVARNCDFTMSNLEIQLEKAFAKVTARMCGKIIKKIRGVEDIFWEEDAILNLWTEG